MTSIAANPKRSKQARIERKRNRLHASALESYAPAGGEVDRDSATIKRVKVLGFESTNGRRYSRESVKAAAHLYENAAVYCNHPIDPNTGKPKSSRSRTVEDRLGKLVNVRMENDGLYADLQLLKTHPMTERVLEAAERMPDAYGLSHAADVDYSIGQSGVMEISEITAVRSVDLVCEPGTVSGLFESSKGKNMATVKSLFESLKLHPKKKKIVAKLFEEGDMPADLPMDAPVEDMGSTDPDEALKQGFWAAIEAVWNSDSDVGEKVKKIGELIKTHGKLTATDAAEAPVEEEDDPEKETKVEEGCDPEKDKANESTDQDLKRENARLNGKLETISLCESAGVKLSETLIDALASLPADKRKAAVMEQKALSKVGATRSSGPGFQQQANKPKSLDSLIAAARE